MIVHWREKEGVVRKKSQVQCRDYDRGDGIQMEKGREGRGAKKE